MKKRTLIAALALWTVVASVILTRLWITHPDLFPEFPKPIAEYLARLFGAQNAEQIADLEILIGMSISVPVVLSVTFIAWRVFGAKR